MLKPLDAVTDVTKSPFVSFSADELPESVREKIFDLPDSSERERWRSLRKDNPLWSGGTTYMTIPEVVRNAPSNDDWCNMFFSHNYGETNATPYEFFDEGGYEWQVRATEESGREWVSPYEPDDWDLVAVKLPYEARKAGREIGRYFLGYHQIELEGRVRILAPSQPKSVKKRIVPDDPVFFGGFLRGLLCSPEIETKIRGYTGGLIDTFELPMTDGGASLPDVWKGRRLVSILGRWQPYNLEKSVVKWQRRNGRFYISDVPFPVFRNDIPPEIELFCPAHQMAPIFIRKRAADWLDAYNSLEGWRSFGSKMLRDLPEWDSPELPKIWRGEKYQLSFGP